MKKTLAVAALLAAFAGSAMADVTLYGRVDTGFAVLHNGLTDATDVGMMSGQSTGSRWGIKGSEALSDKVKVGFQFEGGFTSDDGRMGQGAKESAVAADKEHSRLFGREARVYVATEYGTFHFGRMGTLNSGSGSVDLLGGITAFGTGWGDDYVLGDVDYGMHRDTRRDNVVTYESPKMAGAKVYAQVSLKDEENAKGLESKAEANRYYALGATYDAGALHAAAVVAEYDNKDGSEAKDYLVGASYNFGAFQLFASANLYDDGDEQVGLMLGAKVPAFGGKFTANVGYTDKDEADKQQQTYAVGYEYPFSKATNVYAGVGYNQVDVAGSETEKSTIGMVGLVHKF